MNVGSRVRIKTGAYIWLTATVIYVYDGGKKYIVEPEDPNLYLKAYENSELELLEEETK